MTENNGRTSKRHDFLGCAVDALTKDEALETVRALARGAEPSCVMFLNVDVMVKADSNEALRALTWRSAACLMDGRPPLKVARMMGIPLPEKVSGSDLVPSVCRMAAGEGMKVLFLGGAEGVPERAAANAERDYPGVRASAYSPEYGFERTADGRNLVVAKVREEAPDILFACLGCPKQEEFVTEFMDEMGVPCTVCAGATVDFMAGSLARAPEWVSRAGLEWLYRFLKEPRRLFRRYFVDSWHFLAMVRRRWSR